MFLQITKYYYIFADNAGKFQGTPRNERTKKLGDAWHALDKASIDKYKHKAELDKLRSAIERAGLVTPGTVNWDALSEEEILVKFKELKFENKINLATLATKLAQGAARTF